MKLVFNEKSIDAKMSMQFCGIQSMNSFRDVVLCFGRQVPL